MDLVFKDYLFRCHSIGRLMHGAKVGLTDKQTELFDNYEKRYKADGRPLTDNQLITFFEMGNKKFYRPILNDSAKQFLHDLHKEIVFNRPHNGSNKYLTKGIEVEEKSITLYSEVSNKLFVKNTRRYENDFLSGEPDNTQDDIIRDIKSSWDLYTFPMYETKLPTLDYFWQMQGYLALTGFKRAEVVYCLVDTPEHLIEDEKRRIGWNMGFIDLPETLAEEIALQMQYNDIPKSLRVRTFKVRRNPKAIEAIYAQIKLARVYLAGLSEQLAENIEIAV